MNTRALALLLTTLSGVALGACSDANESTFISFGQICGLPDSGCGFTGKCDAQFIGQVVLDASSAPHLKLYVEVNNRLPNNADTVNGRLNTNDAHITSFDIRYDAFGLASAVAPGNFTVPAAGLTVVGLMVVPDQAVMPAPAADGIAVAHVKAKGYFDNGSSFESGEYPIAFKWCVGCLDYLCPGSSIDPTSTCPPNSPGQQPATGACL